MLTRFSVLDKYECPTDFFLRLDYLRLIDSRTERATHCATKQISIVGRRHLGGLARVS